MAAPPFPKDTALKIPQVHLLTEPGAQAQKGTLDGAKNAEIFVPFMLAQARRAPELHW